MAGWFMDKAILTRAHNARSEKEMHEIVNSLAAK